MTTSEQLGRAMIKVARDGYPKPVLESEDINRSLLSFRGGGLEIAFAAKFVAAGSGAAYHSRRADGVDIVDGIARRPRQLKLIALDADDLAVISAHVQDARVQASDIIWRQGEKRLVVGMSRLDWEQTLSGETASRRLIAALRFDRVLACKSRNIDLRARRTPLELVGIEFHRRRSARRQRAPAVRPRRRAAARRRMPGMRADRSRHRRSRDRRCSGDGLEG